MTTQPLTHAEKMLCFHIAMGKTTEAAANVVGIPDRTADRVRARPDAQRLIADKIANGLSPREVLEMDLMSPNSLDRRRAAQLLTQLDRSAPPEQALGVTIIHAWDGTITHCPECGHNLSEAQQARVDALAATGALPPDETPSESPADTTGRTNPAFHMRVPTA